MVNSWQLFSPGWRLSWVEVFDGDLENLKNKGKCYWSVLEIQFSAQPSQIAKYITPGLEPFISKRD